MDETAKNNTAAPNGLPPDEQPAWRQDFPIDWPQDHFVARRDFTKFLVLTSLPFALVQIGLGLLNGFRRHHQPPVKAIAVLADIPIGGVHVFHYPEEHDPCLLLRPDADTLRAFSQKCTHLSCAVYYSRESNRLECPCHKGFFSVADGSVLQGPPSRPLPKILLEKRGDELVAVDVKVS